MLWVWAGGYSNIEEKFLIVLNRHPECLPLIENRHSEFLPLIENPPPELDSGSRIFEGMQRSQ